MNVIDLKVSTLGKVIKTIVNEKVLCIKGTAKSGRSRSLIKTWVDTPGSLLIIDETTVENVKDIIKDMKLPKPTDNKIARLGECNIENIIETIRNSEATRKVAFLDLSKKYEMQEYSKIAGATGFAIVPCIQIPATPYDRK